MLKPSIGSLLTYAYVKYFVFYFFLMFKNQNYALLDFKSIRNIDDVSYYLYLILFLPTLYIIVFLIPLRAAFKAKRVGVFILLLLTVFVVEYFGYTYLASQLDFTNGLYNMAIGLLLLLLFFLKSIGSIFRQNIQSN